MGSTTGFFGLQKLQSRDPLSTNDYAFTNRNIDVIDRLLGKLDTAVFENDTPLADPTEALSLAVQTTGGLIPAGRTLRYKFTYVDVFGNESAASPEATISTPSPITRPNQPGLATSPTGGTLLAGNYFYILSAYSTVNTSETSGSVAGSLTIPSGNTNKITLTFPTLPSGADGFNIFRRGPGESQFYYLASVALDVATPPSTYVDTNAVTVNNSRTPSAINTTNSTNLIHVTLPGATPSVPTGYTWKIYRTFVSGDYNSSLLEWVVTEAGGSVVSTTTDSGLVTTIGLPPSISSLTGATNRITTAENDISQINTTLGVTPQAGFADVAAVIEYLLSTIAATPGEWSSESIQDLVAAMFVDSPHVNATVTYNDAATPTGKLVISALGGSSATPDHDNVPTRATLQGNQPFADFDFTDTPGLQTRVGGLGTLSVGYDFTGGNSVTFTLHQDGYLASSPTSPFSLSSDVVVDGTYADLNALLLAISLQVSSSNAGVSTDGTDIQFVSYYYGPATISITSYVENGTQSLGLGTTHVIDAGHFVVDNEVDFNLVVDSVVYPISLVTNLGSLDFSGDNSVEFDLRINGTDHHVILSSVFASLSFLIDAIQAQTGISTGTSGSALVFYAGAYGAYPMSIENYVQHGTSSIGFSSPILTMGGPGSESTLTGNTAADLDFQSSVCNAIARQSNNTVICDNNSGHLRIRSATTGYHSIRVTDYVEHGTKSVGLLYYSSTPGISGNDITQEEIEDIVAAMFIGSPHVNTSVVYTDQATPTGRLTLSSSGDLARLGLEVQAGSPWGIPHGLAKIGGDVHDAMIGLTSASTAGSYGEAEVVLTASPNGNNYVDTWVQWADGGTARSYVDCFVASSDSVEQAEVYSTAQIDEAASSATAALQVYATTTTYSGTPAKINLTTDLTGTGTGASIYVQGADGQTEPMVDIRTVQLATPVSTDDIALRVLADGSLVLRSHVDGSLWKLLVSDTGVLTTTAYTP